LGARLDLKPSSLLTKVAYRFDLDSQLNLAYYMSLVDIAHSLLSMQAGITPKDSGLALLQALLELHHYPETLNPSPEAGDLYTNREAWLATQTDAVEWYGCGRARREATTAAFLLHTRSSLLQLSGTITGLADSLIRVASQHREALMPDYTYLQSAQPTSFGHYLLSFTYPMLRDLDRLRTAYDRVNSSPLGCGSTNGSRLAIDRNLAAESLGFSSLSTHARDAMWQIDLPIELTALLSACIINADRLAEDLQVFATQEFGLVELSDSHSRASKIMPQKKNPFALTHIRAVANEIIGVSTSVSACARSPSGQPDNRLLVYDMLPTAFTKVISTLALLAEVVQELSIDGERGQALVTPETLATDLAETLVLESDLPPRLAHHLVGHLIRTHKNKLRNLSVKQIEAAAWKQFRLRISLDSNSLDKAMNAKQALKSRSMEGGTGPGPFRHMLEQCQSSIDCQKVWLAREAKRLQKIENQLLRQAKKLTDSN